MKLLLFRCKIKISEWNKFNMGQQVKKNIWIIVLFNINSKTTTTKELNIIFNQPHNYWHLGWYDRLSIFIIQWWPFIFNCILFSFSVFLFFLSLSLSLCAFCCCLKMFLIIFKAIHNKTQPVPFERIAIQTDETTGTLKILYHFNVTW